MTSNDDIKNVYRKEDEKLEPRKCQRGKQVNQKMKPYLVQYFLMKRSDENHPKSAEEIKKFLGAYDIFADRRSIYRDIEEINIINYMIEDGDISHEEAEKIIKGDEDGIYKIILYDKYKKGFYANPQKYELDDIKLLAECINSSKFISNSDSERLTDPVS